ncbi:DUF6880 family protein [Rhizobium sp. RU36D]|uniref:DUF6880 family protein n=1 Tax=Rhizobium sp. RU36D TaxID=1907415 RepID=UPI0009D7E8BD|nr:DUF6880 family protein [Rhizobium sp. RU36D]SMD16748.1 hypothetical protein SAMN05880593_13048 [Rhizobium sp. RU36D]
MARQKRAKLDKDGLVGLGIDKLVEILLEEAGANKALKARLQTALAGGGGGEEMARLIDKRLDQIEQSKTRISASRAKDLTVEYSGLVRNILSEFAAVDATGAAERILRFLGLRFSISARLIADSARLWKVFDDAEAAALPLIHGLGPEDQVKLVPFFEKLRLRDRYGEHTGFPRQLIQGLSAEGGNAWKSLLTEAAAREPGKLGAVDLLQLLARSQGDVDGFLALEKAKPDNRRDTMVAARMLHDAGRYQEALEWIRMPLPGMRLLSVHGIMAGVGPEYEARERRLLEADILERLKRRGDAQDLRWREFTETLDVVVLKVYLSKLDDFAEFDEMDKALAVVQGSDDIYGALEFFMDWPRHDLAAKHVARHAAKWEGRHYGLLLPAAEALEETQPVAATILYRVLVADILKRGISDAYVYAAGYIVALSNLAPKLPADAGIKNHEAFMADLQKNHAKKHSFWSIVPAELR